MAIERRPFLILQVRPESEAADDEYAAILEKGGLGETECIRVRLDREDAPDVALLDAVAGVVVGGGPGCVSDAEGDKSPVERRMEAGVLALLPRVVERDIPFLGCCYGIGALAHHLGGEVSRARYGEPVGASSCALTAAGRADPLLEGVPERFRAFVGHKEALQSLPEGCVHLVSSAPCPYQMIRVGRNVYATQFHPEADAAGFETRIGVYRERGYFPAADAERLIALCRAEDVHAPERVLGNFVRRYRDGPPRDPR